MTCPNCHHDNAAEQKYCGGCGISMTEEGPGTKGNLEHAKLEFEREKWRVEAGLRRREVELKEAEDRRRRGFLSRIDPISVGIFVAALALIGNIVTTKIQGATTHTLERERFEADLIKEYVKESRPESVERNLRWLITTGLVTEKAEQIKKALDRGAGPGPLTKGKRLAPGEDELDTCFYDKDWENGAKACAALLEAGLPPNDEASVRGRYGLVLTHVESFDKAITNLNRALELDPKDPTPYVNRGFAYRAKGQLDRAIEDYNKALEIDPKHSVAFVNRGSAYREKGQLDRAIEDYNKALEMDPKNSGAFVSRGSAYREKGQLDRAIEDYNKALEIDPKHSVAYVSRGFAYREKGQPDRAIEDFNKAIEVNPKDASAWRNRALSRTLAQDHAGSTADISEALRLKPLDSRTLYVRGILDERQGNSSGAARNFAEARKASTSEGMWQQIERDLGRYRRKQPGV